MNDKYERGGFLKKKILVVLENHPEGLTVNDLSRETDAHRQTIAKYVLVLEAEGDISRRTVGAATLNYLIRDIPEDRRRVIESLRKSIVERRRNVLEGKAHE